MSKKEPEIIIRKATELRRDTTKIQSKALENRINYFKERRALKGQIEDAIAGATTFAVQAIQQVEKIIPEETRNNMLKMFKDFILSF